MPAITQPGSAGSPGRADEWRIHVDAWLAGPALTQEDVSPRASTRPPHGTRRSGPPALSAARVVHPPSPPLRADGVGIGVGAHHAGDERGNQGHLSAAARGDPVADPLEGLSHCVDGAWSRNQRTVRRPPLPAARASPASTTGRSRGSGGLVRKTMADAVGPSGDRDAGRWSSRSHRSSSGRSAAEGASSRPSTSQGAGSMRLRRRAARAYRGTQFRRGP
jgi:hypothetical protein